MRNIFTEHPAEVGENYFQHMRYALQFSYRLIAAGLACFIHAFLPFLFEETASDYIAKITKVLSRGKRGEHFAKKLKKDNTVPSDQCN